MEVVRLELVFVGDVGSSHLYVGESHEFGPVKRTLGLKFFGP